MLKDVLNNYESDKFETVDEFFRNADVKSGKFLNEGIAERKKELRAKNY